MSYQLVCDGSISLSSEGYPVCSDGWSSQVVASTSFDISNIDAPIATAYFTSGFVIFVIPWATAYGFKMLLDFIKEV